MIVILNRLSFHQPFEMIIVARTLMADASKDGTTVKQAFGYTLDDDGTITKITHEDGSYWDYGYDGRNRLTLADRKSASGNIVAKAARECLPTRLPKRQGVSGGAGETPCWRCADLRCRGQHVDEEGALRG
jgi:YD repeat-containing protein